MSLIGSPFILVTGAAALAYGLVLQFRPVSAFRTGVKTMAVGALALWSFMAGAPPLLTTALALSALGDAFLAGDPKKWLPPGLASFLAAHMVYVAFFLEIGRLDLLIHEPWRLALSLGALATGLGVVIWLWKDFGPLRPAVAAYMAAITAMVATALTLSVERMSAMAGAAAFMTSDGILSWRLFRHGDKPGPIADHAVWWLYYAGQAGIAAAFLL